MKNVIAITCIKGPVVERHRVGENNVDYIMVSDLAAKVAFHDGSCAMYHRRDVFTIIYAGSQS
jgi:hypothetical protein